MEDWEDEFDNYKIRPLPPLDEDTIEACQEWIARQQAELDQRKKQFEDQYPLTHPAINRVRMNLLEGRQFWIDLHKYELEQRIQSEGERP